MSNFYDPSKAIKFAKDFWNRPCSGDANVPTLGLSWGHDVPVSKFWDQRKFPPDKFEPRFVYHNKKENLCLVPKGKTDPDLNENVIVAFKDLEDCAHFVSRCLMAGGLPIKTRWSVPTLMMTLQEREDTTAMPIAKTLAQKVSHDTAQAIINAGLLEPGDIIGYVDEKNAYFHAAMFAGVVDKVGRVTCHSYSRFPGLTPHGLSDAWELDGDIFTLLRIGNRPPPQIGLGVTGWWEFVDVTGTAEYVFLSSDGRAISTEVRPTSKNAPGHSVRHDRGYWFGGHSTLTLCWRPDGTMAKMKLNPWARSATLQGYGGSTGRATKITWPDDRIPV